MNACICSASQDLCVTEECEVNSNCAEVFMKENHCHVYDQQFVIHQERMLKTYESLPRSQ